MPWLIATALIHSAIVVEKRNALKIWTILLSILAFSLSLIGTFLVRSGVLTSVHAFAVDPQRGVFILAILVVFIGGALTLFALRAPAMKAGGLFAPISREGALVVNNLLLCVSCAAVLFGTLYPLGLETLTGEKISVGPPYFNLTFGIIILPLLALVPLGPLLTWKRGDLLGALQRIWGAAVLAILAAIAIGAFMMRGPWLAPIGIALGLWIVLGALWELALKIKLFAAPLGTSMSRLMGLPGSSLGTTFAHLGLGIAVLGIVSISAWKEEHILSLKPGETADVAGYTVQFVGEAPLTGPNYTGTNGAFVVTRNGAEVSRLNSEKRIFQPSGMNTTEVGLHQTLAGDLYVVMGDTMAYGARAMRMYYNPWVSLIWLGSIVMFAGGVLSLSDRRYRIGAPKPAARAAVQPAE
jgi:cytochrome c-type biogenesis protein CcmF